jgi:adenine-specific DNA-methyltransferase
MKERDDKMHGIEKLNLNDPETQSVDVVADNIDALRSLFPEAFEEGKIDFEVLKQLLGGAIDEREEKYGLNWHGKRKARQIALTPSTGTLLPCPKDSVNWDTTQNLMIEGDNLEVLKLLQKSYAGKVKLIYIDPPYNTGSDFVYPDDFRDGIKNYLRLTGQIADDGLAVTSNPESSGRFHTDWLNMMYSRLRLARGLLRQDGAICVSIDDNEIHSLRSIMDEIFGAENFLNCIAVKMSEASGVKMSHATSRMPKLKEYIVIYRRSERLSLRPQKVRISDWNEEYKEFLDNITRETLDHIKDISAISEISNEHVSKVNDLLGTAHIISANEAHKRYGGDSDFNEWRWSNAWRIVQAVGSASVKELALSQADNPHQDVRAVRSARGKLYLYKTAFNRESKSPRVQILFADESLEQNCGDFWSDIKTTGGIGGEGGIIFPNGKKPLKLLRRLIDAFINKGAGDLVLDFFAGSGTTGHAILEENKETDAKARFILVQIPEIIQKKDELFSLGFKTVSALTVARLKNAVTECGGSGGFRLFKLAQSNIRAWEPESANIEGALLANAEHLVQGRTEQDVLYELLLKVGLDLCVPIEKKEIAGKTVHSIGGGALIVCLADGLTKDLVEALANGIVAWRKALAPAVDTRVVFKDSGFADDVVKTNMAAILNQNGILDVRSL